MAETIVMIAENQAAPGRGAEVRALFEGVVERTRSEDGCLRYELFQDREDDDRIILLEEWRDEEALNAHLGAEHIKDLFQKIMQLLTDEGRMTHLSRIG